MCDDFNLHSGSRGFENSACGPWPKKFVHHFPAYFIQIFRDDFWSLKQTSIGEVKYFCSVLFYEQYHLRTAYVGRMVVESIQSSAASARATAAGQFTT